VHLCHALSVQPLGSCTRATQDKSSGKYGQQSIDNLLLWQALLCNLTRKEDCPASQINWRHQAARLTQHMFTEQQKMRSAVPNPSTGPNPQPKLRNSTPGVACNTLLAAKHAVRGASPVIMTSWWLDARSSLSAGSDSGFSGHCMRHIAQRMSMRACQCQQAREEVS
jgi:hypothetical protein